MVGVYAPCSSLIRTLSGTYVPYRNPIHDFRGFHMFFTCLVKGEEKKGPDSHIPEGIKGGLP